MKRSRPIYLGIIALFLFVTGIFAQETTLLPESLLKEIIHQVSGEKAWWDVNQISQYHRIVGSKEYHQAALYVESRAKDLGLDEVQIEKFPADGKTWNFTHKAIYSWDPEFAELWVVDPFKKKIADFDEIRLSLCAFSRDADFTAELIDVGSGDSPSDYEGLDVKGKLVLASGSPRSVQSLAVFQHGALGVVSYYTISWMNSRKPGDFPDQVSWSGISAYSDDGQEGGVGFMISYRSGMMLHNLLAEGKSIRLKANVKARVYEGDYEVVSAVMPGIKYPDQELVFLAHLDHYRPGANDNASGCAVLLEIARSMKRLVADGIIDPPLRTLRFLWLPEITGTIPYLDGHPEAFDKYLGVINMDMVGADQVKTRAIYHLTLTPHSLPTYFDDVIQNFTEYARDGNREGSGRDETLTIIDPSGSRNNFDVGIERYAGGSDHYIFTDGGIGIPSIMFGTWPDINYHTNEDTPDMVDPTTLKRTVFLGVASAVYLAGATGKDVPQLAMEIIAKGRQRIASDEKKAADLLSSGNAASLSGYYQEARNIIQQAFLREEETVLSCLFFSDERAQTQLVKQLRSELSVEEKTALNRLKHYYFVLCQEMGVKAVKPILSPDAKRLSQMIPVRNLDYRGPLGDDFLKYKLGDDFDESTMLINQVGSGNIPYETLNFVNGKRSITEIRDAVSAEYSPVSLRAVEEYITLLVKAGIVVVKK